VIYFELRGLWEETVVSLNVIIGFEVLREPRIMCIHSCFDTRVFMDTLQQACRPHYGVHSLLQLFSKTGNVILAVYFLI
jgi:hypothetical protein